DSRHRQLRLVHLQPRPVPGRARRRPAGAAERRDHGRRGRRARPGGGGALARAVHARRGRRHRAARAPVGRRAPDPGRLPRSPGDRRGVRRPRGARRPGHARQDVADRPRGRPALRRPRVAHARDALSLAARRARVAPALARGDRPRGRRPGRGPRRPARRPPRVGGAVPPGVHPHRGRPADPAELPPSRGV
ncbi:MAG: Anthranilate synthase, amidotransferase component @ Para-aminobenzoate synthase, amidotransferase component, partial [uncultured Gemmatimonadaceae bacterium]